jgi:heme/copper-type cytochrome/quinol oxidase subunit 2
VRTLTGREVLVCLALLAVALYAGNLALFHAWAGSGPPTDRPEWHVRWAAVFCAVSVTAVVGILAVIVRGARAARRRVP